METTTRSQTSGTGRAEPTRARASAASRNRTEETDQYDLLTAMLLGLAVGSAVTFLFRRGPRGRRPIGRAIGAAGEGAQRAAPYARRGAKWVGRGAARGAGWARERGQELWDRVDTDAVADEIGEYLAHARDAINDVVSDELADLRKAVKRRRKRLGI